MRTHFVIYPAVDLPGRSSVLEYEPSVSNHQPITGNQPELPINLADVPPAERVLADGKFFRIGAKKFFPKGVT